MAYVIKNGVIHYVGKGAQAPKPAQPEKPTAKPEKKTSKKVSKKK